MAEDLVTFVIDGSEARRGAIPADAFLAKLREFVTTIYAFDRAFSKRPKRQLELEIVDLSRNSPAQLAMRARSTAPGYEVDSALDWTFDQLTKIYEGKPTDPGLPQAAIDTVIDLATYRRSRLPELGIVRAGYRGAVVPIDETLEKHAREARAERESDTRPPWRAGVSRGSLFGELRGVMDFEGERQFFVSPPSGPSRVQCVFTEELREQMVSHLFQTVRVKGFLHYAGGGPFPVLMEATQIEATSDPTGHLSDIRGIFEGMDKPEPLEDLA